jgi:hypothetical protein
MALQQVWQALSAIHGAGFLHNDVRWPNVVRSGAVFVLVDYDLAQKVDSTTKLAPPVDAKLSHACHWTARLSVMHGQEVDMWGLAHLMRSCVVVQVGVDYSHVEEFGAKCVKDLESVSGGEAWASVFKDMCDWLNNRALT